MLKGSPRRRLAHAFFASGHTPINAAAVNPHPAHWGTVNPRTHASASRTPVPTTSWPCPVRYQGFPRSVGP